MQLKWFPSLLAGFLAAFAARPAEIPLPQDSQLAGLRVAVFDIDATPPIGSHMAYDPVTNVWDLGLRARGIVLLGAEAPIVLCALDWIGIANEAHDAFRSALADAAGTTPARVAIHTLHQHDAPECDFGAERILREIGREPLNFEGGFAREVIGRLKTAVGQSLGQAQPVTHLGLGEAPVHQVASNRRILGPDGKVRATRYTTCKDPLLRAEPAGVIDPVVSLVSLWNGELPLAVLSYYAVHPQSYYRTGVPNPDVPGLARFFRQLALPSALHVHFNGAGANVGAGKYNDGSHENRLALAERLADGMKRAWETTRREPITADAVRWTVEPVVLAPAKHLTVETLQAQIQTKDPTVLTQNCASKLAWLRRCQAGQPVDVACLALGPARVLYMPGELFVEFQLAAKAMRPNQFVAMAAYGDYGPGYICTAIAYEQGGYEASPGASNVGPDAENILLAAIRKLLQAER
jgi:hypothetical protein